MPMTSRVEILQKRIMLSIFVQSPTIKERGFNNCPISPMNEFIGCYKKRAEAR